MRNVWANQLCPLLLAHDQRWSRVRREAWLDGLETETVGFGWRVGVGVEQQRDGYGGIEGELMLGGGAQGGFEK